MNQKSIALLAILVLGSTFIPGCSPGNSPAPSVTASPSPVPSSLPIVSEDITWKIGETTVSATITRPADGGRHPALVFVPGSGPTDKDWNSPLIPGTNGSARLLAAEMAKQGLVTLRYDKRFTGPYAGKNLPHLTGKISLDSHIEEIAGAVNLLVARPDVDAREILVFANSEGTVHALNYQLKEEPKFAGLILLAPPGRTLAEVTRSQIEAQVAAFPNSREIMAGYDKLMADFLAGNPFTPDPNLPEGINSLIKSLHEPVNLPFTREIFALDIAPWLSQVNEPVLVIIGKKDIQIDWQLDGQRLEKAATGKTNVTFRYPENANHVMKNEPRPRSALTGADALTYNASDRVLDQEALKMVIKWLATR